MTKLLEMVEKLTPAEVKEVEDFAEFLLLRSGDATTKVQPGGHINVKALAGMCEGMGGTKDSVELVHEAMEEWASKLDRR